MITYSLLQGPPKHFHRLFLLAALVFVAVTGVRGQTIDLAKFTSLYRTIAEKGGYLPFHDKDRINFKRWPETRKGARLDSLRLEEKIILHDLLNDLLSTAGYLKVIATISHEDVNRRTDELLGRDRYWVTFFGNPQVDTLWSFRFEGHHVSLNFTFDRNRLIANTPFVLGSYPSVMQNAKFAPYTTADAFREGMNILFEEEEAGISTYQRVKNSIPLDPNRRLLSESISVLQLRDIVEQLSSADFIDDENLISAVNDLYRVFSSNFRKGVIVGKEHQNVASIVFGGQVKKGEKFYFRLITGSTLIEFENVGNHIHYIIRDYRKDFGTPE